MQLLRVTLICLYCLIFWQTSTLSSLFLLLSLLLLPRFLLGRLLVIFRWSWGLLLVFGDLRRKRLKRLLSLFLLLLDAIDIFKGWSWFLYDYGLCELALGLLFLWQGGRTSTFECIGTIWGACWFLGYCSLLLIFLDLALKVSLELLDPLLYFINAALTRVLFLRFGVILHLHFDLPDWPPFFLLKDPPRIFFLFADRGLLWLR